MKKILLSAVLGAMLLASCNTTREGTLENANIDRNSDNPNSDYDRVSTSVSPRSEVNGAYPQGWGSYNNQNITYDTVLGPTTGRNNFDRRGKEHFYDQAGDEKITVF